MKEWTREEIERLVPEAKLIPWPHKDETGPDTWHIGIYCVGERDRPETYPYTFRLLLQTRLDLEMANRRLRTIQRACGYVGNGSSTSVKIFQDDATSCWIMQSGARDWVYSDHGFLSVIDEFDKVFTEDEHGELVKREALKATK